MKEHVLGRVFCRPENKTVEGKEKFRNGSGPSPCPLPRGEGKPRFPSPLGRRCHEVADEGCAIVPSVNQIPNPTLVLKKALVFSLVFSLMGSSLTAANLSLKDVARVGGSRDMELVGYGLVTGLRGTGDRPGTNPSAQSMANLLSRLGLTLSPQDIASSNVAAVAVTARASAYSRSGATLDARISSIGTAVSLEHGTLLLTPLLGSDGRVYATAQGALASDPEETGEKKTGNAPRATTVSLLGGVTLEKSPPVPVSEAGPLVVTLNAPDYTTAERIAQALRQAFQTNARAVDPARVEVEVPTEFAQDPIAFAARVEWVTVSSEETPRVVINEITGTVVAGENVKVSSVTIAHRGLKIEVGRGNPANVTSLVSLLDGVGARPKDVVTIFTMLKRLGALKAELVVM